MKLIVPNKMNEIRLADYQRFVRLEGDEEFLARKAVEIFCNLKMDVILQMKAASLTKVTSILMNAFAERPALTHKFTIGKQTFGFIPSIEEITVGELNDIDTYISDWPNIHRAMSVLYRPVVATFGNRYEIEKYEGSDKYAEQMKEMPLDVAIGAMLFFWTLGKDLSIASLTSLEREEGMNLTPLLNFLKSGVGSPYTISSPEETP